MERLFQRRSGHPPNPQALRQPRFWICSFGKVSFLQHMGRVLAMKQLLFRLVALSLFLAWAAQAAAQSPDIAIIPFAGDVYTENSSGNLIPVDPISTPPSA